MNLTITIAQNELLDVLLNIAPVRPVFIWGAPGIGKSALVEKFAAEVGLPCVSLLGSQLAPEDIIGIPQINGETSEFLPPKMIAYGFLTPAHAGMFLAYIKHLKNTHMLDDIMAQKAKWPAKPEDRDVLYFLAQSFRAKLLQELPKNKQELSNDKIGFIYRSKSMIKELSTINFEIAQMVVSASEGEVLPDWFMVEIVRDLPRLVSYK